MKVSFSSDQAEAFDAVSEMLKGAGIDLDEGILTPRVDDNRQVTRAVTGKAGSGKTLLLAQLYKALEDAGVDIVSGDWTVARNATAARWLSLRRRTRQPRFCATAGCLRPRSTAYSIPLFTTPNTRKLPSGLRATATALRSRICPTRRWIARWPFIRTTNLFRAPWRRRGCAGRISSRGGSGAMIRWISGLSTRVRCSTKSSWKTCRKFFQPS